MGEGGTSSDSSRCWRRRISKQIWSLCSCFHHDISSFNQSPTTISTSAAEKGATEQDDSEQPGLRAKSLCAICLDPLGCTTTSTATPVSATDGPFDIFTAECTHNFHLACIASNVRHGSITCPICRAQWSRLPRHHLATAAFAQTTTDPILQILEDSIATSRVNRRSSLRSTRLYDDDDPLDPLSSTATFAPRLHFALVPTTATYRLYLSVKLAHQSPADIVLVVSPNGPHLRLLKQAISLVVFALCSTDRLAIVTCSATAATRVFPLRCMSPHGKRSALRVVDRLLYLGPAADPAQGIRKGVKILEDRNHRNSDCCILHLSDSPAGRPREAQLQQLPVPVHRFYVGFGFGASNGFVMHEFHEFLGRLMGGVVREAKVRVGLEGEWVRLGEVGGGEERRIPVDLKEDCEYVCVRYSYVEGRGDEEQPVTGETVVGFEEKGDSRSDGEREVAGGGGGGGGGGRTSCGENWDYFDPFMARRWAKHLHRA